MWEGGGGERGEMSSAPEQDSNLLCSLQKKSWQRCSKQLGKIVFTGGHFTLCLAFYETLASLTLAVQCIWPLSKLLFLHITKKSQYLFYYLTSIPAMNLSNSSSSSSSSTAACRFAGLPSSLSSSSSTNFVSSSSLSLSTKIL